MVIQPGSNDRKLFVVLQHKWLVTRDEMRIVGTEIVEEAFDAEA